MTQDEHSPHQLPGSALKREHQVHSYTTQNLLVPLNQARDSKVISRGKTPHVSNFTVRDPRNRESAVYVVDMRTSHQHPGLPEALPRHRHTTGGKAETLS